MTYTRRFDLSVPRNPEVTGGKKTYWLRIGSAFEKEDGRIDCRLDALPLGTWDGRFYLFPQEDEDAPSSDPPPEWRDQENTSWKPPEGYVPKIHFQDFGEVRKGVCGNFAKAENRTSDWEKVTCKACLKERPNG